MGCNNKYIMKESDEGTKFIRGLLRYTGYKINGDNYKNIASSRWWTECNDI